MSKIYRGYAVEGDELNPVEIDLHIGFLNAALVGRLAIWADPEARFDVDKDHLDRVSRHAFRYADAMVAEFRNRTRTLKAGRFYLTLTFDECEMWIEEHKSDQTFKKAAKILEFLNEDHDSWTWNEAKSLCEYNMVGWGLLLRERVILHENEYSRWPKEGA